MVDTFPDTLSEVAAKTVVITITCVKTEAPLKTDGDIDAGLQAYTHIDTINEFEPVALLHLKAERFLKNRPTVLPTHRNATRERVADNKKHTGDLMTDALFDFVADTLAEIEGRNTRRHTSQCKSRDTTFCSG